MAGITLTDFVKNHPCKGFTPKPYYAGVGDFLTYYFDGRDSYADRVDEVLTVFRNFETKEVTGFKLKGVRVLHEEIGDFGVAMTDDEGNVMLVVLIMARLMKATPDVIPSYQAIADRVKRVPLARDVWQRMAA